MQNRVLLKPYRAVNGEFASINPYASAVPGFLADSTNGAYVGRFAWRDTVNAGYVKCTGTGVPLGVILREMVNPITGMHVAASDFVEPTYQVTVAVTGDVHVMVESTVTVGQKVFVNTTNGKISGGAHLDFLFTTVTPESGDNPKTSGWYEKNSADQYIPTEDTTVTASKTYYSKKANLVETNWEFVVGASANDVATISNHGNTIAALG